MLKIVSYIIILSCIFSSCEKVIDISLNDAEKKYVVEGVITDAKGGCSVLVSTTKNFADDNSFEGVDNAVVTITDNSNNPVTLRQTSKGVYTSDTLYGISNTSYTLTVSIGGALYAASSVMPTKINMDSLYITEDNLFGETKKNPNVEYKDPQGKGNNYRFVLYVNNNKEKDIYIRNDDYSDGNNASIKLRISNDDNDKQIKSGDAIRVDMLCISTPVYKYWYSFNAGATGDNNSASPANPVSNISGGVLGYFSAHTTQTKTITVP